MYIEYVVTNGYHHLHHFECRVRDQVLHKVDSLEEKLPEYVSISTIALAHSLPFGFLLLKNFCYVLCPLSFRLFWQEFCLF